ncbi:MAG: recombinase family protein [Defluviitaleaceae bacterium]|nr:recombinase family protein [Defluviitaleaceae bacterium]MCL2263578.1 recombinase family protein [Defluviitaleaceae bacterium]
MPFLNAMNDYFLKNLSDKIKAVLTAKAKDGQKLSGVAPFGYERDPQAHTRLIVDEHAAKIVQRIFALRTEGLGYAAIAAVLNDEKIMPPRLYYLTRNKKHIHSQTSRIWLGVMIKHILHNEIYCGHTVAFKRKTISHRDGRTVPRDKSEWLRTENTHPAIISGDVWDAVQRRNTKVKAHYSSRKPQPALFSKIIFCADCKKTMTFCNKNYICRTHADSGGSICTRHSISETVLTELIFSLIKKAAEKTVIDEESIRHELQKNRAERRKKSKAKAARQRGELQRRLHALDAHAEQLYEKKLCGAISAETFTALAIQTEEERLAILDKLAQLKQAPQNIPYIKKMPVIETADKDVIATLIEKIEIGEKQTVDGVKAQDVLVLLR